MDTLKLIVFIVYIVAGWWAINKIWYSKHTYIIHQPMAFYMLKFFWALIFGWIAIPIAIIMTLLKK